MRQKEEVSGGKPRRGGFDIWGEWGHGEARAGCESLGNIIFLIGFQVTSDFW